MAELQQRSGTSAPDRENETDVGTVHFTVTVEILGAAATSSPSSEDVTKVSTVDHTVVVEVSEAVRLTTTSGTVSEDEPLKVEANVAVGDVLRDTTGARSDVRRSAGNVGTRTTGEGDEAVEGLRDGNFDNQRRTVRQIDIHTISEGIHSLSASIHSASNRACTYSRDV